MDPSSSMGGRESDDLRHRIPRSVPNRSDSSSPSSSSLRHHNHLGLRPKALDSLHTRLRTSNPIPKHVSMIEDVTSLSKPKRQITLSREPSSESRDDIQNSQKIGSDDTPNSPLGNGHANLDQEEEEYEEITTDIGLYDETVYDEYLGPLMGSLRRKLITSLQWESPILARHQARVRNPRLDRYFVYTSLLGTHSFFLVFLPVAFWIGNARFARGLVNVLAFGVYLSSAVKDALCIPRPYSPPVTRLVIGTTHLEYGFLSTHSTNCSSVALYFYLWLGALRNEPSSSPYIQSWLFEVALLYYVVSVIYGRIYAGMHSIMDCLTGCVLGIIITLVQWHCFDFIETSTVTAGWSVPVIVNSLGLIMVIVHPQPLDDCPCFEDAIAFLSVIMGIVTARWAYVRQGLLPMDDNPLKAGVYAGSQSVVEPAISLLRKGFSGSHSQSLRLEVLPFLGTFIRKTAIVVVGISAIAITRIVVKAICRVVLPPIFRFTIGYVGFILPRRHYQATAVVPSPQKARPIRPAHKRRVSSAGGNFFSNISDPTEYDSIHWKLDNRSTVQQSDDQRQSDGQIRPARAERSKVKFTMGDGTDVPVPFTHPNKHLPGDALSGRLAGAFSAEEKQRQQREMENSYEFPTRQETNGKAPGAEESPPDAVHYDVDVLTKVFVYHAIGFFAGGPIPAFFDKMGW